MPATPRPRRLYLVSITPTLGEKAALRLIRAKTDRGAILHVVERAVTCRPATPDEVYDLARGGVELEDAGADSGPPEVCDHDPAGAAPGES